MKTERRAIPFPFRTEGSLAGVPWAHRDGLCRQLSHPSRALFSSTALVRLSSVLLVAAGASLLGAGAAEARCYNQTSLNNGQGNQSPLIRTDAQVSGGANIGTYQPVSGDTIICDNDTTPVPAQPNTLLNPLNATTQIFAKSGPPGSLNGIPGYRPTENVTVNLTDGFLTSNLAVLSFINISYASTVTIDQGATIRLANGTTGLTWGVGVMHGGSRTSITNDGTISTLGRNSLGISIGATQNIATETVNTYISNNGLVVPSADNIVVNNGTISTGGINASGIQALNSANLSILNTGSITATGLTRPDGLTGATASATMAAGILLDNTPPFIGPKPSDPPGTTVPGSPAPAIPATNNIFANPIDPNLYGLNPAGTSSGVIVNTGTISANTGSAIEVRAGDMTIVNRGTLSSTQSAPVHFGKNTYGLAEGGNTLILQTGSVLNGDAVSESAGNILRLQGRGNEDSDLGVGTLAVGNGVPGTSNVVIPTPGVGLGFEQLTMGALSGVTLPNNPAQSVDMSTLPADVWTLSGTTTIAGTAPDSVLVRTGTLVLGGLDADGDPGGNVFTNGGVTIDSNATLQLGTGGVSGMVMDAGGNLTVDVIDNGQLNFYRSNDLTYAGAISGTGVVNQIGPNTVTLTGGNTYSGGTNVLNTGTVAVAATSTSSKDNLGTGTVFIDTLGTVRTNTNGAFSFDNALTGTGLLTASNNGGAFSFGADAATSGFAGMVALSDNTFQLTGNNTAALTSATLELRAGNITTVGPGGSTPEVETIHGLTINDGTLVFNDHVPGDLVSPANIVTTNLDVSSTGTIRVDDSAYDNTPPTPNTSVPLLEQDDGALSRLITATNVTGTGGALTLADLTGNTITNGTVVEIDQGGVKVAEGTYDFRLVTSADGVTQDGLYVGYGLNKVNLIGTGNNALILTPATGATGLAADLSAQVTGIGDLAIVAGANGTVSLSNALNDYTGVTDVRSGTLLFRANHVLGLTSDLEIASGATVTMDSYSQTVGAVHTAVGSRLDVGTGTLTISDAQRAPGVISGGFLNGNTLFGGSSAGFVIDPSVLAVDGDQPGFLGKVTITGGSQLILNSASAFNNAAGIDLVGATDVLTFSRLDAFGYAGYTVSPNGTASVALSGPGTVEVLNGADVTFAGDNSNLSGAFNVDATSVMRVSLAKHLGTASIVNDGQFHIDTSTDWQIDNAVSGTGNLYKQGTGTLVAGPNLTYSGTTFVNQGTLAASAANTFSSDSIHDVAATGTLDLRGFNQTIAGLTNAGLVNMGTGTTPGTILTVNGNYVGNGGVIAMNTVFNDDASPTDKLVINGGSASGNTVLRFTNVGGTGAQTVQGIRVVETTNSGTTTTDAFSLGGQRYTAGAYEYMLERKGEDWFLTSELENKEPIYRPEAAVYASIPAMARSLGLATLGTLHERVGEEENIRAAAQSRDTVNGMWGRVFGERQTNSFTGGANPSVNGNLWGLQAGLDLYRNTDENGHRDHAGVYFSYGGFNSTSLRGNFLDQTNARAGSLSLLGPSVGAYWTHFGPSGWYVDAVVQGSWYDVKASSVAGSGISTHANGLTASLETGYPIHFGENAAWLLEPQAQLIYQNFSVGSTSDNISRMNWNTGDAWTGRLGLRLQYTSIDKESGTVWQPYARVNLWQNFTGSDGISFDGNAPIDTKFGGTSLQGALGLTAKINNNISLYGEASYRHSIGNGPQDQSAIAGTFGLRLNW
jgi:autotransporter family porin